MISMYKPEWAKNGHYYLNPPSTEDDQDTEQGMLFDTLKRLRRKY